MKKILCGALAGLVVFQPAAFAANDPRAGGTANFFRAAPAARALAMGNAQTAVARGADAIFFNPAALAGTPRPEISTLFSAQEFDQTDGSLAAAAPFRRGVWGLSAQFYSVGDILLRQQEFDLSSRASGRSSAVTLAYGQTRGPIAVGVAVKYLSQSFSGLSDRADGQALDLGAARKFDRLTLGVVLQNLLGQFRWSTGKKDDLRMILRAGAGYQANSWLLAALDVEGGDGQSLRAHGGLEGRYKELAFRAGVNHDHPTLGFGLALPALGAVRPRLDYALEFKAEGLNDAHAIGLSAQF